MKITINKESIIRGLMYTVLAAYLFFAILNSSFYVQKIPEIIFKLVNYASLGVLVVLELIQLKWERKTILVLPILVLVLAIALNSFSIFSNISIFVLFSFFYRKLPFKTIATVAFWTTLVALTLVIASALAGLILNYLEISGERIRHYVGFRYSLFPPALLLNTLLIRFYIKEHHVKLVEWAVWLVANYWLYRQTDARLAFYSAVLLLAIWLILKYYPSLLEKLHKILSIFTLSFPVAFITSWWFALHYSGVNSYHLLLNNFLGNRLYLMHKSMELYGYKLIGQNIDWVGNGLSAMGQRTQSRYLYVDNLYMQFLQRNGLVITTIFIIAMTIIMIKLYQKKSMYLYIVFINLALHGMIDDLIGILQYNIFLMLLGAFFVTHYQIKKSSEEEKKLTK